MKQRHTKVSTESLLRIAAFAFVLFVIAKNLWTFTLLVVFLCALVAAVFIVRRERKDKAIRALIAKSNAVIDQHIVALARTRTQLVRLDAYGTLVRDKWDKEIGNFLAREIASSLSPTEKTLLLQKQGTIAAIVEAKAEAAYRTRPAFRTFSKDFTPAEFEIYCAEQLSLSGWETRVTQQSRDQGIDIIAKKTGIRLVLQCKLYSGSVGNKAVQEIAAGRIHEGANHAVVVSNSRFTSAAEQLAATNGVLLIHYSDLSNLDNLLGLRQTAKKPVQWSPANRSTFGADNL